MSLYLDGVAARAVLFPTTKDTSTVTVDLLKFFLLVLTHLY